MHRSCQVKLPLLYSSGMKISVIVLNWNGKEDTLQCLASLETMTTPHEVIVVDNGSTDDSTAAISKAFPKIKIIETGKNLGYAEGNNVGIRYALDQGADYILILNNDTIVTKTFLEGFLLRDASVQGGKPHLMDDPFLIDILGANWNPKTFLFDPVAKRAPAGDWTNPIQLDHVLGAALFVKREVFEKVGLFDARFFVNFEEIDWCFRARRAGYPSQVCPEAVYFHKKSASFVGGKPHRYYYLWRNRLLWAEKNCSAAEKKHIRRETFYDVLKLVKNYFTLLFHPFQKSNESKRDWLRLHRAALSGIKDYYLRRFGEGPAWLLKP